MKRHEYAVFALLLGDIKDVYPVISSLLLLPDQTPFSFTEDRVVPYEKDIRSATCSSQPPSRL